MRNKMPPMVRGRSFSYNMNMEFEVYLFILSTHILAIPGRVG